MYEIKSLKANEAAKKVGSSNAVQKKAQFKKLVQFAAMGNNTFNTNDVAQLKKMMGSQIMNNAPVQREEAPEDEELQMKKDDGSVVQMADIPEEEEEPVQMKKDDGGVAQMADIPEEEEETAQMKMENNTGMPDQLKAGVENLSGMDMSDVRVHYNSDKPAGVGALAYTQGTDIHVAPGQERHLAHEAWHVVQQAQGRVEPTTQLKDVAVNDDPGLEHEADVMGERASGG